MSPRCSLCCEMATSSTLQTSIKNTATGSMRMESIDPGVDVELRSTRQRGSPAGGTCMAHMAWNIQCHAQIEALEGQQTALIESVNQLHEAMMSGEGLTTTGPLLRDLVDSARSRFR